MSTGPLSSVMIIAGAGLMADLSTTLIANTDLANNISNYQSIIQVGPVISAALNVNVTASANIITDTTFANLVSMGDTTVPALGDAVVSNLAALTATVVASGNVTLVADEISNTASFTQVIQGRGNQILGDSDLSIFAQIYGMSQGYQAQTNTYINSTKNSDIIAVTFTNMDSLTTGGISQVTTDTTAFGSDLANLGTTIDLSRLQYLGHPWLLLRQMLEAGGMLPGMYNALNLVGVTDAEISTVQDNQPEIAADLDKRIYDAFLLVTGDDLQQVCDLLDVTISVITPTSVDGRLSTAADLLNPFKMLPNSWQTLITQIPSGTATLPTESITVNVYQTNGAVDDQISNFYRLNPVWLDLSRIIPPDQAAANLAWARSFYQIKNIINLSLPDLARSIQTIETNQGLGDINALNGSTGPIPNDIKTKIYNELCTGSGLNGTLLLEDFMGTVSGVPWTSYMANVNSALANIANLSAFANITSRYTVMLNMLDGDYGDPITGPITLPGDPNIYADADQALEPLVANAVADIASFQSSYPAQSITLNDLWIDLGERLIMENDNLALAGVNFQDLRTNRSAVMALGTNLHSIGTDPISTVFFESIANAQDQGGQAVIASMREGRNIDILNKSGVGTDTQLSTN